MKQPDLFTAPTKAHPVSAPPTPLVPTAPRQLAATLENIRGKRPIAWTRLLAGLGDDMPELRILVLTETLGILETLSHHSVGRKALEPGGTIIDMPPDSYPGVVVFQSPEQARLLHVRYALVPVGTLGAKSARFRLATADEHTQATLKLPEGM